MVQRLSPQVAIAWLTSTFRREARSVIAGVGEDDCGVISIGESLVVVTADFLNATPIAEQLGMGSERCLGRLAVAATLSDLLGSGAVPTALIVGVTVPHGYAERRFRELMLGIRSEARRWNTAVIGGDTKLGHGRAVLTCGIGTVGSRKELFLTRDAKPGDVIFASGYLGTCAAATLLAANLRNRNVVPMWARRAITVPQLPLHRSRALATLRIANGGIDISDGLGFDIHRLCRVSGVGALIHCKAIPVRPVVKKLAGELKVRPWSFSFSSGGDFQFIVTVPRRHAGAAIGLGFTPIGQITRGHRVLLEDDSGRVTSLPQIGHQDRPGQLFADEIAHIAGNL
jgi:thiamine-monophosphate kinase